MSAPLFMGVDLEAVGEAKFASATGVVRSKDLKIGDPVSLDAAGDQNARITGLRTIDGAEYFEPDGFGLVLVRHIVRIAAEQ